MSSTGQYASTAKRSRLRPKRLGIPTQRNELKKMKLTFKQRIRNWLMDDDCELSYGSVAVEQDRLDSDGMRLQVYKASGGFVIEVRKYDRREDENRNSMYVINNDKDLGEEMGKIITMECMK